jgi:hypothetical protein
LMNISSTIRRLPPFLVRRGTCCICGTRAMELEWYDSGLCGRVGSCCIEAAIRAESVLKSASRYMRAPRAAESGRIPNH